MKDDGKCYTRKAIDKHDFHCGPLQKQNLETIRTKTDLKILKHNNINIITLWNSRKTNLKLIETNLKLIENITVEVPNRASLSKGILFHVSKFLE